MTGARPLPARGSRRARTGLLSGAPSVGVLAALALSVAFVALVLFQYVGLGAARALGLVATPQRFTQLSFVHPDRLPLSVTAGQPLRLSFAVANHEGRRVTYHWSITIDGGSTRTTIGAGAATIAGSQRKDVTALVLLPPFERGAATIRVALSSPAEAISLHVRAT